MSKGARSREKNAEKRALKKEREAHSLKMKKVRKITALTTICIILVAAIAMGTVLAIKDIKLKSGSDLRAINAVKSDNFTMDGTQLAYILDQSYNSMLSNYAYYAQMYGTTMTEFTQQYMSLDLSKSLHEQDSPDENTAKGTWFDYFFEMSKDTVSDLIVNCELAKEAGIELTDKEKNAIRQMSDKLFEDSFKNNSYIDLEIGVKADDVYNAELLKALASKYQFKIQNDFPDESTVESTYEASPKKYQKIDYLTYSFTYETEAETTEEAPAEEDIITEETAEPAETAMSKDEALSKATVFSDCSTPDDFINTAALNIKEEHGAEITDEEVEEHLNEVKILDAAYSEGDEFSEWAFADDTVLNATKIVDDEASSTYHVYMLTKKPALDEAKTVNVRHILFTPTDYGTEDKAKIAAEKILDKFNAGDKSEESFAELAMANSSDGSKYAGGLYSNVKKGQMVTEFNDWIFDENRKAGDVEIVKTEYGYHIIYFVSDGQYNAWQTDVASELSQATYDGNIEAAKEKFTVKYDRKVDKYINLTLKTA